MPRYIPGTVFVLLSMGLLCQLPACRDNRVREVREISGAADENASPAADTSGKDAAAAAPATGKPQAGQPQMDPSQMTWRAFIDPKMSMQEIEALSPEEARARLEELKVPFAAENFHESIEMDPVELTALFLQGGMDVDMPNQAGVSPLMVAAFKRKPKHLSLLLKHGADVSYLDPNFHASCVDFAVGGGDLAILHELLEAGADPGGGAASRPILLDAISSGNMEMFEYIFERYPDYKVLDSDGQGALMNACLAGELEMAKVLVAAGADVNATEPMGGAPVSAAAFRGHWELVRYLMENGADPTISYRNNRNMFFEMGMHPDFPEDLADELLERGLDINQLESESGRSPLINAAANGGISFVEYLLKHGARTDLVDANGYTACDYAKLTSYGDMVLVFARYGITSEVEPAEDQ